MDMIVWAGADRLACRGCRVWFGAFCNVHPPAPRDPLDEATNAGHGSKKPCW